MLKLISKGALIAAIASLALAGSMTTSFAQKKKAAAAPPKPACTAGQLCTGSCNESKWCAVHWCQAGGTSTPTFGFCFEGGTFCPQKC